MKVRNILFIVNLLFKLFFKGATVLKSRTFLKLIDLLVKINVPLLILVTVIILSQDGPPMHT